MRSADDMPPGHARLTDLVGRMPTASLVGTGHGWPEPTRRLSSFEPHGEMNHGMSADTKKPPRGVNSGRLEKSRQRPTFAVTLSSALAGLTAVFGMGRDGQRAALRTCHPGMSGRRAGRQDADRGHDGDRAWMPGADSSVEFVR
jgi:hypothetical protein